MDFSSTTCSEGTRLPCFGTEYCVVCLRHYRHAIKHNHFDSPPCRFPPAPDHFETPPSPACVSGPVTCWCYWKISKPPELPEEYEKKRSKRSRKGRCNINCRIDHPRASCRNPSAASSRVAGRLACRRRWPLQPHTPALHNLRTIEVLLVVDRCCSSPF
jgi:hypothetical protein